MRSAAWIAAIVALGLAACSSRPAGSPSAPQASLPPSPAAAARPLAIASFYPLYEFTARIAGDHAEVRNLVSAGAAPHDYEPTAQDLIALQSARLVVYNGAGFEPWLDRLLPTLPPSVKAVKATEGLRLVKGEADTEGLDPHVWLDPVLAQRQVDNILAGFVAADPGHRAAYQANAARLKVDLVALHDRFTRTLRACGKRAFITTHAAFGYLARRYGLTMMPITGLTPEAEPSLARMREVINLARTHDLRVIYFETLVSPKVAETIAREVGAKTLVLNPVEGLTPDQRAGGATYFTVMDENLRHLAEGLDCR
ncbi:MAG: hypothetical protein A2Z07_03820 [Armatimonadetes bacterium RBG_16_67_12]|nr:MAG: hypothetical protein A2Z07_03820 [Armatimonadetes bacterium RBG_16_67_12]